MAKQKNSISPSRSENFPEWYQKIIKAADLAENSEVRGCMVIKPWGFGIWENIRNQLDYLFKKSGHQNAYFPLLIPLSYLEKEAQHAGGFATECAVVTHHQLQSKQENGKIKLIPTGKLTEPFVIRPTSETIIGSAFSRWVQSYRDLPLLINQWANVMRWEMRPRLFLRTAEFLWQEGHTAHETKFEAIEETLKMLKIYKKFMTEHLAIPVISGEKTKRERFPGAVKTFTVETLVQDKKAIQAGTSHFLGQNFSKASNIKFQGRDGETHFVWTTSWGVSTRLIGAMLMTHGDDDGVILPPRVANSQIIIIPIIFNEDSKNAILETCDNLASQLEKNSFNHEKIRAFVDKREISGANKKWDWIKKGAPIRVEIGPRDLEHNTVTVYKRHEAHNKELVLSIDEFIKTSADLLQEIQNYMLQKAEKFVFENSKQIIKKADFYDFFSENAKKEQQTGGFAICPWAGSEEDEELLQNELKVTIRCIPDESFKVQNEDLLKNNCFLTGKKAQKIAIFAKSY